MQNLNIVVFGLSITSSWGNGHATTFRSLLKALAERGHSITFFEQNVPWYANNRDLPRPGFCDTVIYDSPEQLTAYYEMIEAADLVILGSYVRHAQEIANQITQLSPTCFAFYDLDTPVTLAKLDRNDYEYLHPDMIPGFDLYLSFTGGPVLQQLEDHWGAQRARALYCSVDPLLYYPEHRTDLEFDYALGYLGTYSQDRQPSVQKLLLDTANERPESRFCIAGAQYPVDILWPANVERVEHIPPKDHRSFYNRQRFTLNVTRNDMISAGYSPSVRLFEAGACGTPVISDYWSGLDSFFDIGEEILIADSSKDVGDFLKMNERERLDIGQRFREKVLKLHTSEHRAVELESHWCDATAHTLIKPEYEATAARL